MTHIQVIRDIRERGYICVCGEETTQPCIAALNAIVFLFDSMPTVARIGNDAKAAGRELIVVVDEAHEIVQARKYKVCEVCNLISIYCHCVIPRWRRIMNRAWEFGCQLGQTCCAWLLLSATLRCNMRACNFVPGHLQDS